MRCTSASSSAASACRPHSRRRWCSPAGRSSRSRSSCCSARSGCARSQVAGTLVAMRRHRALPLGQVRRAAWRTPVSATWCCCVAAAFFSLYTVLARRWSSATARSSCSSYTLLFGAPPMLLLTLPSFFVADARQARARRCGSACSGRWWSPPFVGWLVWAWVNACAASRAARRSCTCMPPIAGVVAWLTLGETFHLAEDRRRRDHDGRRRLGAVRQRPSAAARSGASGQRLA